MNVLVAGGTGFIGTSLCKTIHDRGHEVTALSHDPDDDAVPDGVNVAMGDVSAYDSIEPVVAEHEAVINLVSLSPLYEPPGNLTHDMVHRQGTEHLVRAAIAGDVDRFVQMSGLGVDPNGPTAYLRAKGKAETIVREADLDSTIVRPSVVFGEGAEFLSFTRTVTTPYLTVLPGGGKTRFQPIWVEDLVSMMAEMLESPDHVGQTYEIGGPEVLTLADVTRLIYNSAGKPVRIIPVPLVFATVGFTIASVIPFVPFGPDQARSLRLDNTVTDNDIEAFGRSESDLETFTEFLGL